MEMQKFGASLEETLLPALLQCFGIIFIGYILGKAKVLGQTEIRGLTIFVQYLCLPALIFTTVATIPFTQVKWEFIAAVFVAKVCIFICVAVITMLLTHPLNLGKAGIFAIAATQSNDFALGYPLLVSLYQNTHPEYPSYLYIIAPIQLLLLNTIGFFFLEIEKHNKTPFKNGNCHLFHVVKGTLQNPVVIMTIVGLIWNVTYGQTMLPIFENILKSFSSAFPATALILVGYTMTVKTERASSPISLSVTLLIIAKTLFMPLILQKFSTFLLKNSSWKEIQSFSSFGFLYGTIPVAPTVYVFATQYETCVDAVTKIVIGSTLFSAPLMFASASVISLAQIGVHNLSFYLNQSINYTSTVNMVCCIWSLIIFWNGKRWKSVSFGVTFYLVFSQLFMSIGGILLFFSPENRTALFYAQYVLTNGSIYATRMCTLQLAVLLLIIRVRSLCFILQRKKQINIISIIVCLILPYAIAASLLFCNVKEKYGPNYPLGFNQIIATFVVTMLCLAGTVLCLILQQIYLKKNRVASEEQHASFYNNPNLEDNLNSSYVESSRSKIKAMCSDIEDMGGNYGDENCPESENLVPSSIYDKMCDSRYHCSTAKRIQCSITVSRYISENNEIGTGLIDDEYFFKHILLLILLSVAMTLCVSVCFWRLLMEEINGIFIVLEFLDIIVNYSLGTLCFIMFGLDTNLLDTIYAKITCRKQNTLVDDIVYNNAKENL